MEEQLRQHQNGRFTELPSTSRSLASWTGMLRLATNSSKGCDIGRNRVTGTTRTFPDGEQRRVFFDSPASPCTNSGRRTVLGVCAAVTEAASGAFKCFNKKMGAPFNLIKSAGEEFPFRVRSTCVIVYSPTLSGTIRCKVFRKNSV